MNVDMTQSNARREGRCCVMAVSLGFASDAIVQEFASMMTRRSEGARVVNRRPVIRLVDVVPACRGRRVVWWRADDAVRREDLADVTW